MVTSLPFYIREDDPPAKREILRAALKLFSTRGLVATSIRDIARESGYTNPALYKHFAGKDALALHLFETCHARVWQACSAALAAGATFDQQLEGYVGQWLELVDRHPEVIGFLSDSARVLWPRANPRVRRQTMIGLARTLAQHAAPSAGGRGAAMKVEAAAACLEGTLAELARMIAVGVVEGPATRWKSVLVALFKRLVV
ncbi:MAG: TetR/AcrR family transcriptional regulator [Gemmatimonadota bacterium]